MSANLRVIEGGWQDDEARMEAVALADEVAGEAEAIYVMAEQVQKRAMRLMHKATQARIEFMALSGPKGAA